MNDAADKNFDPTEKKLVDSRAKGDVPQSRELHTACVYAGFFLSIYLFRDQIYVTSMELLTPSISWDLIASTGKHDTVDLGSFEDLKLSLFLLTMQLIGLPFALVLVSLSVQSLYTVSFEKISFKLNRISPIQSLGQKFGVSGIVEWGKNCAKTIIFCTLFATLIYKNLDKIVFSSNLSLQTISDMFFVLFSEFLAYIFVISITLGMLDYRFQLWNHSKKLRMSRKEIQDEVKESEGDPHLKNARRNRSLSAALGQSLTDVKDADVIITNPTHFAVALSWQNSSGAAPVCVCKGVDALAQTIRELAAEHKIPVYPDPPTARAIYATTPVGSEIPPHLYRAVAAAINFSIAKTSKKA